MSVPAPALLRLRRDDRGSATVEFGFVATALSLLVIGMVEFGVILFLGLSLEHGVIEASRFAITGATVGGVSRQDRVLAVLRQYTFGLADIGPSDVTTLVYPSFDDIGKPEPFTDVNGNGVYDPGEPFTDVNGNGTWNADMGAAGLGGPGDIVVYRVNFAWGLLTRLLEPAIGDVTITSGIAVRNEPF